MSRSGAIGRETAKGIADAAMLEVANISVGPMVCYLEAGSPTVCGVYRTISVLSMQVLT